MKTKNLIFGTLLLAVIFVAAVSSTNNSNSVADHVAVPDTVVTGLELFRLNCAGCHGINREGKPPTFPSLLNVKEKFSKEQIHTQIKNGKGLMPSLEHLADDEINAITAYLFNEPKQQTTKNYSPVEIGKNIVMSNCVSCHRLTVNDPIPPNTKTMCQMMEPAAFAGTTKRFTQDEFNNILQTGPCYMPSFDFLTAQDKDAIWAYLKTLEGKGEPEGKTMGQMCPMIKQMRKGKSSDMMMGPMMGGMKNMNGEMNMQKENADKKVTDDTSKTSTDSVYYTCSMHPEIKSDKPGNCPKCGMKLIKVEKNKPQKKQNMKMMCPMMKTGKSNCCMNH